MATQGLLSITKAGTVQAKIVTGANGFNIPELAKSLRVQPTTDGQELLARCLQHDLGGCSLVIQLAPDRWVSDVQLDKLPPLYALEFYNPRFNPRWDKGTASYTEIVEIEALAPDHPAVEKLCRQCKSRLTAEEANSGVCNICFEAVELAAHKHVAEQKPDDPARIMWHGWALREAFIAGFKHAATLDASVLEKLKTKA